MRHVFPRALAIALLAALLVLPTGGATTAARRCAIPPHAFNVGTHNTLQGTARFTPFASIIGWQEVQSRAARAKLVRQLGPRYQSYIPRTDGAAAIPISWRRSAFEKITSRSVMVHGPRRLVTPSRWINVVHLRQKSTGRRVIVVNTHFISEAFHPGSSFRAWRLKMWWRHARVLIRTVREIRARHPHDALIVLGDFNRDGYFGFREGVRPLRLGPGSHPIDHQYAGLPAVGGCVQRLSKAGSDHWRRRALIWWKLS